MKASTSALVCLLLAACWGMSVQGRPASQPPGGHLQFDVNDVSFLFPPPATPAAVASLMSADMKTNDGSPLWPSVAFTSTMAHVQGLSVKNLGGSPSTIGFEETLKAQFETPATWKVVGIRVDPSAPGGHPDFVARFGAMPQLRLILQPVTIDDAGRVRVHDFAAHLVFGYFVGAPVVPFAPDRDKFRNIVADLAALKAASTIATTGALGVHPALKAGDAAFAGQLRAFVAKHASASRLFAISFMGVQIPEPWIFAAFRMNADGTVTEAAQRTLQNGHAQMLTLRNTPRAQPVPETSNVDAAANKGVSTGVLFSKGIDGKMDAPVFPGLPRPRHRDIADLVANPQRAHFFNTDCVSCHTESTRRASLSPADADQALRFALPAGVSGVDPAVVPKDSWNVRNFGWFQQREGTPIAATVTMRAANETAESVDLINREYLTPSAPVAGALAAPAAAPAAPVQFVRASLSSSSRPTSRSGATLSPTKKEQIPMVEPAASPLTLVMDIKSPQDHQALKALIAKMQSAPPAQNPIAVALTKLETVHFARFVFLSERQLAVITTYDGTFERYIDAFVLAIGPIFDQLLAHMQDAPPLPVSKHRDEFLAYVQKHDLKCEGPLYSAYPELSVQDILTLQSRQPE